jgi:hypothetical protein
MQMMNHVPFANRRTAPATVVVIDENPAVLELSEQALRDAGHRVLVTTDPCEALAAMRAVRVDLVVAMAQHLAHFEGHPSSPKLLRIGDHDGSAGPLLGRPFSLTQLQAAVELALAGDS